MHLVYTSFRKIRMPPVKSGPNFTQQLSPLFVSSLFCCSTQCENSYD